MIVMRKLSKLAAWIVIVALTASLFSGVVFTVSAEPASPLSETYTEATELLTNLQIMDNSTKAWTDAITAEEANTTVKALFFNTFSWSFEQFGLTALTEGEAVTGAKLLHLAIAGMLWGTGADQTWTEYFHLTNGIENYDPNAQLTREQAAQLYLNVLKANPQYNPQTEIRANALGIKYQLVSYDGMGRPSYQWQRTADNSPLTAVYAAKPLAVLSGDTDWNDVMAAAGISGNVSSTLGNMGWLQPAWLAGSHGRLR